MESGWRSSAKSEKINLPNRTNHLSLRKPRLLNKSFTIDSYENLIEHLSRFNNYKDLKEYFYASEIDKSVWNNQDFWNNFAITFIRQYPEKAFLLLKDAALDKNIKLIRALVRDEKLKTDAEHMLAFAEWETGISQAMLEAGISIDSLTHHGFTGLTQALFRDDRDKAQWLLNQGAGVTQTDLDGKTLQDWVNHYLCDEPTSEEEVVKKNFWNMIAQGY